MYLLRYRAKPNADHSNASEIGGAYVNCWMELGSIEAAKARALEMISEDGWTVDSLDDAKVIHRSECEEDDAAYFDQALIDKTVLVFHCWPVGAPDANEEK